MMDESQMDAPRTVPIEALYKPKMTAAAGTARRVTISPFSGSSFRQSERVQFILPVGAVGEVLATEASYLQFAISNSHNAAIVIDGCVSSCIESVEVFIGGRLVQRTSNYGALFNSILDATASVDARATTLLGMGCAADFTAASARTGHSIAAGETKTFATPILGLLGMGASKYIPVGAIKQELRLDIVFASSAQRMFTSTATFADSTVAFTSLKYQAQMIRLDAGSWNMISQPLQSIGYSVPVMSWVTTVAAIPAGQSVFSIPIGISKKSVSAVLVSFHLQSEYSGAVANTHTVKNITKRTRDNLREISLRAGSERYPQQPIDVSTSASPYSEARTELARVFKAVNSSSESSITLTEWVSGAAFLFGFSLDTYGSASGELRDGVDLSLSSQLQVEGSFSSASAALTVIVSVLHDQLLTVKTNECIVNE